MNSGRRIVTKTGSLPLLTGPIRLRKFRQSSESPKRHWISVPRSYSFAVFDQKDQHKLWRRNLYRAPVSVTPSDSRMWKISDSRILFWVSSEHTKCPSSDLSLIWAERDSFRDLCQIRPVRELFKPAEFGPRFSSGDGIHSSSKGRKMLNIPFFNGCLISVSFELVDRFFTCSDPLKWSSDLAVLMLVASSWDEFSSDCRFALSYGGEPLESSIWFVEKSMLDFCFMVCPRFCKVGCYQTQQRWEINLYVLKKFTKVRAEVSFVILPSWSVVVRH